MVCRQMLGERLCKIRWLRAPALRLRVFLPHWLCGYRSNGRWRGRVLRDRFAPKLFRSGQVAKRQQHRCVMMARVFPEQRPSSNDPLTHQQFVFLICACL